MATEAKEQYLNSSKERLNTLQKQLQALIQKQSELLQLQNQLIETASRTRERNLLGIAERQKGLMALQAEAEELSKDLLQRVAQSHSEIAEVQRDMEEVAHRIDMGEFEDQTVPSSPSPREQQ